jgi:hypothetical protein
VGGIVAIGRIARDLRVMYRDQRSTQNCGKATSPFATLDDIVDWAARNADPGDRIALPIGMLLVRQEGAKA